MKDFILHLISMTVGTVLALICGLAVTALISIFIEKCGGSLPRGYCSLLVAIIGYVYLIIWTF
jgi:hypothetical protein